MPDIWYFHLEFLPKSFRNSSFSEMDSFLKNKSSYEHFHKTLLEFAQAEAPAPKGYTNTLCAMVFCTNDKFQKPNIIIWTYSQTWSRL